MDPSISHTHTCTHAHAEAHMQAHLCHTHRLDESFIACNISLYTCFWSWYCLMKPDFKHLQFTRSGHTQQPVNAIMITSTITVVLFSTMVMSTLEVNLFISIAFGLLKACVYFLIYCNVSIPSALFTLSVNGTHFVAAWLIAKPCSCVQIVICFQGRLLKLIPS